MRILLVRGQKVLLDAELARLYGVSTGRLNEQVKRNLERFPADFMFQLTKQEVGALRSQFAMSNARPRGEPYDPVTITRLFITDLTPSTPAATRAALSRSPAVEAVPKSVTAPSALTTSIPSFPTAGSRRRAATTLAASVAFSSTFGAAGACGPATTGNWAALWNVA